MAATSYNLKFTAIEIISKTLAEPPTPIPEKPDVIFNYLLDIKLSQEQKIAGVITEVTLLEAKENTQLAFFKILCVFEFPDFDQVFTKVSKNKYDTPVEIEILLKSAGISTIRGFIFSELRGTYLQSSILPLIDIPSIVIEQRKNTEL